MTSEQIAELTRYFVDLSNSEKWVNVSPREIIEKIEDTLNQAPCCSDQELRRVVRDLAWHLDKVGVGVGEEMRHIRDRACFLTDKG